MDWKSFFPFKRGPKSFLGIDIGASAVKMVELSKNEERYILENYAIFPLGKYLVQNDYEAGSEPLKIPNEGVAEAIQRSLEAAQIVTKEAFLSLPVNFSFSTLISFPPGLPESEIASAAPLEARKYIPIPISDVVLDWNVIDSLSESGGKQAFVIAVPKEVVNDCTQIVKLAGLNLHSIEGEVFSLQRSLIGNDKSTIVIIDAGARSFSLSVIDKGNIRAIHNLKSGGVSVTKKIAENFGISFSEAEELKYKLSKEDGDTDGRGAQAKTVIDSMIGALLFEIQRIIKAYESKHKIEKCILTGEGARLYGLENHLKSKFQFDVSLGNPFARVSCPPLLTQSALQELGPELAVAVGLAMR